MLSINNLNVNLNKEMILKNIHFDLAEGDWLMICGPNGSGKSSLIKALSGQYAYTGEIQLLSHDHHRLKADEKALLFGVLDQHPGSDFDFTVEEVVRMGRYPHLRGWFKQWGQKDQLALEEILIETHLEQMRDRPLNQLSGGERQRAYLAQLFLQNPKILILDEPSNHLDLIYEKELFSSLQKWLKTPGRAIITVMHDLSLAQIYGSHALLLRSGQQIAYGRMEKALSATNLKQTFQMDVVSYLNGKLQQWQSHA